MFVKRRSLFALILSVALVFQSVMPVYASVPEGSQGGIEEGTETESVFEESESDPQGSTEGEDSSSVDETESEDQQEGETASEVEDESASEEGNETDPEANPDILTGELPPVNGSAQPAMASGNGNNNASYISTLPGDYYINNATVSLNGHTDVDNYEADMAALHTAVYEDQVYEYHGGKIFIGNEVILSGNMLPEGAVISDTPADAEGKDANGEPVTPIAHGSVSFDGTTSYVYTLKDIPAEVSSKFNIGDYDGGYQYESPDLLDNIEFYAWEYENDANGEYVRKSVTRISDSDILWDDNSYAAPYSLTGSVKLHPSGSDPIALVAYVYDCWEGDTSYVKDDDPNAAAIGFIEYSGGHSSFSAFTGSGDYETQESYVPVRHRADHFIEGFSLFPYYYHKQDGKLTLYGFDSLLGQFMSGYSDLTVDDYYLETLRIPATWTDPETETVYDVSIASIADGARAIDPGYAETVIISDGVGFPEDCSELFGLGSFYLQNFIIEGDPASVGSNITNMSDMFSYGHTIYSTPLNTVDIAALNTSNVTDMSHMFEGVEVSSLDVSHFDVSKVTDFSYMFYDCDATSLDVSGWEAGKSTDAVLIDMSHMFEGEGQFNEGSRLKRGVAAMGQIRGTLNLSGFDFSHVMDMSNMFANQGYLTKIIFPDDIDTSKVTNMRYMFSSCSALTEIRNIERFDTTSVTDMGGMFGAWNVPAFIETRAGDYDGPWLYELMDMTGEDAADTFSGTKSQNDGPALASLDLSGWDTSKVKNMAGMFSMPKLTTLTLSDSFHTEQVRNMNGMFTFPVMTDTGFLSYISIRDARLAYMMIDMPLATSIVFKSIDLSNISDTTYYFCYWSVYAPQVTELDLSGAVFGTAKGAFGEDTFRYMNGLSLIKLPAGMPQFNYPPVMPVTYYDEDGNEYPTLPGGNRKALTLTNSENYLKDVALRAVLVYDGETHEYVADASEDTVVIYHWGTGEYSEGDYNAFRNEYPDAVSLELVTDPENPNPEPKIKWEVLSQDPDQAGGWVIDPRLVKNNENGTWIEIVNDSRFTTGTAIVRVTINDDIVYDCNIEVCNSPYTTSGSSGSQKELTGTKDGNRYLCRVLGDGTVSVLRLKTANATSVDLTGGVGGYTVSEIGSFAFDGASSVTGIKLGSSVKKLGSHAFCNCSGLKTFEAPGLEEIGVYAFYNCYQLYEGSAFNSVSSVKKVGDKAFRGCAFSSVDLSNATTLGKSVFMECASLSELTLDNEKLTAWGDNILAGEELSDTQITSFTVPDCITQIGDLDNNDYFGSPFPTGLEELHFGSNVTVLGDYALAGMRALKRVNSDTDGVANIPSTVTAIGSNAFKDWNAPIHELTIPASVTSVGQEAFYGGGTDEGRGLYSVTFAGTLDTVPYRMFYENKSIQSVSIPNLSEGAEVSEEAFKDCDALETLIIDDEITAVGKYAFYGCENLSTINAAGGRNVNFLTKAVTIGDNAFEDCESLDFGSIILPVAKTIGQRPFDGCDRLTSISLPKAETLGDYAFEFCTGLTSIIFSENIKKLGSQMIEGTAVTSVDLSMATGLTELERFSLGTSDPYNRPSHLTEVVLPDSLKVIGLNALINTSELTSVTLPEGLIAIEPGAFAGSGLTSLTIPDSVKIISGRDHTAEYDNHVTESGKGAFEDCSSLTTVNFGSGLEIIGNSAFMNCTGLTSIDMSSTAVRVIGSNAFYRSSYYPITELRLSDATQSIGYGAFNSLSNGITSMRLPSSLKEMGYHEGIDWAYPVFGTTFDRLILPLGMKKVGTDSFNGNSYNGGNTVLIEIPYTVTNIDGLKCNGIMKKASDGQIESNGGKEYLGLIVYGGTETEWNRLVDTYILTQSYPQDWSQFHILFNAGWTRGANGSAKYVPYDLSKFYPAFNAGENYDPAGDTDLTIPSNSLVKMGGAYYYFEVGGRLLKDTALICNGRSYERYEITDTSDPGYDAGKKYGNFYQTTYASADLFYFNSEGRGTLIRHFATSEDASADRLDESVIADGIYIQPNDPSAAFIVRDHKLVKGSNQTVLRSALFLYNGNIYHADKGAKLAVGYAESPEVTEDGHNVTYGWYFDNSATENVGKLIWFSKTIDGTTTYYKPAANAASVQATLTGATLLDGDHPDEEGQNVHFANGIPDGLKTLKIFGAATEEEVTAIDVASVPETERVDINIPLGEDSSDYVLRVVTEPASPNPEPEITWSVATNAPRTAGNQVLQVTEDPDDSRLLHIVLCNPGRSRLKVMAKAKDTNGQIIGEYEKECLFVVSDSNVYPTSLTVESVNGSTYVSPFGMLHLRAEYSPAGATTFTDITWKSSNNQVVTVTPDPDNSGQATVYGLKAGNAVIQASTGNNLHASITVTVGEPKKATSVILSATKISLYAEEEADINGLLNPLNDEDIRSVRVVPDEAVQTVRWSSSNTSVATIDADTGIIRALKPGSSVIKATTTDGTNRSASCTLTVNKSNININDAGGQTVARCSNMAEASSWISENGNDVTDYTIKVFENMSVDISALDYDSREGNVTVDLNGHSLSGTGDLVIGENVKIISSALDNNGSPVGGILTLGNLVKTITIEGRETGDLDRLENVTVNATKGTVVFASGKTYTVSSNISAHNIDIYASEASLTAITATGTMTVRETAGLTVENTLTMNSGLFVNCGTVNAGAVKNIFKLDNKPGAFFAADTITVAAKGAVYAEPDSTMHIRRQASLCNIYLGQDSMGADVVQTEAMHPAILSRTEGMVDGSVVINGALKAIHSTDRLQVFTENEVNPPAMVGTPGQTILFTTNIKAFPIELIELDQPEGRQADGVDYGNYKELMQVGNNVLVASDWITLSAVSENGDGNKTEVVLRKFSKWSDVVAYVNTLSNASTEYILTLTDNVTTLENLTFPAKAKSFTIRGDANFNGDDISGDRVKLVHLGNVSLATNMTFENVILEAQVYDKTAGRYVTNDKATISLNGKTLKLADSYAINKYASATGTGNSALILDNVSHEMINGTDKPLLIVSGAVSVPRLEVTDYAVISENNALTVNNDAYLTSADIDVKTNITIKNLHTLDRANSLSYASAANNSLSISGTVDCVDINGDDHSSNLAVKVRYEDDQPETEDDRNDANINSNAVNICVKYIEGASIVSDAPTSHGKAEGEVARGAASEYKTRTYVMTHYTYDQRKDVFKANTDYTIKNLVNSVKAPASYFVVGRDNDTSVQYILKKVGNALRIEATEDFNVTLYSIDETAAKEILGNFGTLQEALSDIDRYGVKTASYVIEVKKDASEYATKPAGKPVNYTMPKQAVGVSITTAGLTNESTSADYAILYMDKALTINSNVVLRNVIIADNTVTNKGVTTNTKLNITLNGFELTLDHVDIGTEKYPDTDVIRNDRLGAVTGNGSAKSSALKLVYGAYVQPRQIFFGGNINNVGTLSLDGVNLETTGTVNVGNIDNTGSILTGTASVKLADKTEEIEGIKAKRKSATEINPNITIASKIINNTVDSEVRKLKIVLRSGNEEIDEDYIKGLMTTEIRGYGVHTPTSAQAVYDALISGATYRIVKAPLTEVDDISYKDATSVSEGKHLIKNNGFICYTGAITVYTLSELIAESESRKIADFMSFADAVTEINNRNDGSADYVITTRGNSSLVAEAFAMPAAKKAHSLTIKGVNAAGEDAVAELVYGTHKNGIVNGAVSKFTLTTDTTFKNIAFVNGHAATRTPVTIAMSGKKLTLDGVTFVNKGTTDNVGQEITLPGRGLLIDGGKTGVLKITGTKGITAGRNGAGKTTSYIEGTISNLTGLVLDPGTTLEITDYVSAVNNKGVETVKAAVLTITGTVAKDGVAGLALNANTVSVTGTMGGTVNLNDISVEGATSVIKADRDLNIKGNITLDAGLILEGRQKSAKAGTPVQNVDSYISIGGAISGSGKVNVGLYKNAIPSDADRPDESKISIGSGTMVRIASAPKCTIQQFTTSNKDSSDAPANTIKLGNIIYAADDAAINVVAVQTDCDDELLVRDDYVVEKITSYSPAATTQIEAFGYYPSIADAVAAIDAAKDKKDYVLVLLNDIGVTESEGEKTYAPISLTFPKAASTTGLGIISNSRRGAEDAIEATSVNLLHKNNLTLNTKVVFKDVVLAPTKVATVRKVTTYSGGKYTIALGNNELRFANRKPADIVGYWDDDEGNITARIGNITQSKTGSLKLEAGNAMYVEGNVTAANIVLESADLELTGALNASELNIADSDLSAAGAVTVKDIKNDSGTIKFNRGSLKITGRLTNVAESEGLKLDIVKSKDSNGVDIEYTVSTINSNGDEVLPKNGNYQSLFAANKKLFTAGLVTVKDVVADGKLIKLGSDFYCIDENCSIADNIVSMTRRGSETDPVDMGEYLDLNMALSDINARADVNESYTITVTDVIDANIRDNNAHSSIVMPGDNKAGKITITGGSIMYSGNIAAYGGTITDGDVTEEGGLTFDGVTLEPVTAANNKATGEPESGKGASSISLARNKSDKTGNPVLELNGVTVGETYGGHIANISGTKGVTDVFLKNVHGKDVPGTNGELCLTGNFSNVRNIVIDGSSVVAGGKAGAIGALELRGTTPTFTSLGAITVPNVVLDNAGSPKIVTVSNGTANTFTISGGVLDAEGKALTSDKVISIDTYRAKSKTPNAKRQNPPITLALYEAGGDFASEYGYDPDADEYTGINIINAPKAWDGYFSLGDGYRAYKSGAGVYNAKTDENWEAVVSWTDSDLPENKNVFETYAHTYAEAVADINTYETAREYTIELKDPGIEGKPIWTAGKVTATAYDKAGNKVYPTSALGAMAFPAFKNAKSVKITSNGGKPIDATSNHNEVTIMYTGNITPSTYVSFENVTLDNGTINNKTKAFVSSGNIPVSMTTGYDLTIGPDVNTPDSTDETGVTLGKISGAKGVITVRYGDPVKEKRYVGAVKVGGLQSDNTDKIIQLSYEGQDIYLDTWDDTVRYINARANKNTDYTITLLEDLHKRNADGSIVLDNNGSPAPIDSFALPAAAAAKSIVVKDDDPAGTDHIINFKGNTVSIQTNVTFDDIGLAAYSYNGKAKTYSSVSYNMTIGNNYTLTLNGDEIGEQYSRINQITGGGLYVESQPSTSNPMTVTVDKVVNMRELIVNNAMLITNNGALTASVRARFDGAVISINGNATLKNSKMDQTDITVNGNVSATATNLSESEIHAKNIAMTGNTEMTDSKLDAGLSAAVGTGKISIVNLKINKGEHNSNEMIVKQDKNGTSMLSVTGVAERESDDTYANIRQIYNNQTTEAFTSNNKPIQTNVVPYSGMIYVTFANNAKASQYAPIFKGIYVRAVTNVSGAVELYCPNAKSKQAAAK